MFAGYRRFNWLAMGLAAACAAVLLSMPGRAMARETGSGLDPSTGVSATPVPSDLDPPWIETRDRAVSMEFYRSSYLSGVDVEQQWTGDAATCLAGSTSDEYRDAIQKRINYYRAMAGVPAIVELSDYYNSLAQQAALITGVNGLNHNPTAAARCYTSDGATAAANSHLYIGRHGPRAIDGYIKDHDEGYHDNYHVGHRRWILFPQLEMMGSGDIAATDSLPSTNALWVVDSSMYDDRPRTREPFVAWPPPGYVPYTVVYPRWSFAWAGADFSHASVSMHRNSEKIPVNVAPPYVWEPTEATLVWIPMDMDSWEDWPRPSGDTTFTVTVSNFFAEGEWRTVSYDVNVFDPEQAVAGSERARFEDPAALRLPGLE